MLKLFKNDDLGKLILRLAVGGLILLHGVAKLRNPEGAMNFIGGKLAELGLPQFLAYGVYLGEVVGPLLAIVGLYARIGGLLMAGNMVIAIALVHTHQLAQLTSNGGWQLELQGMFLFGALAILFLGSGSMAVKRD
ncbi:MAG: DoxX family protein [Gammaproteobacteria bacterium]|nr:DoxX family protein [Gammaproteobacteria bacterium]